MLYMRAALIIAGLTIVTSTGIAAAPEHRHPAGNGATKAATSDNRVTLNLNPTAQEGLKLTMREHLAALQEIVASLAHEDYKQAAAVAHRDLGFPKHHQAIQREQSAVFPEKYQELAMTHHQAAEDLAAAISTKKMNLILNKLGRAMEVCVGCHQSYRLD